jgi:hypothetical protein
MELNTFDTPCCYRFRSVFSPVFFTETGDALLFVNIEVGLWQLEEERQAGRL